MASQPLLYDQQQQGPPPSYSSALKPSGSAPSPYSYNSYGTSSSSGYGAPSANYGVASYAGGGGGGGGGVGASAPPSFDGAVDVETRLREFQAKYEINEKLMPYLRNLHNYEVVLVCDDSGSMSQVADADAPQNGSRWQELQQSVAFVLQAHAAVGATCDIYFINRGIYSNVNSYDTVRSAFAAPPAGGTNLVNILNVLWTNKVHADMAKPLLVHVFTDGHPTNNWYQEDIQGLANWLSSRRNLSRTYVSFLLCTDDEEIERSYRPLEYRVNGQMGWNGPTCGIQGVDVTEDYRGELRDVRRLRGFNYRFTFGDYIVKCLVGAVEPSVHAIDLPLGASIYGTDGSNSCCTIL